MSGESLSSEALDALVNARAGAFKPEPVSAPAREAHRLDILGELEGFGKKYDRRQKWHGHRGYQPQGFRFGLLT